MRLLVGGACIRAAKEGGCKPLWAICPSQVASEYRGFASSTPSRLAGTLSGFPAARVLSLPHSQTKRRHTFAVVTQLVRYRPFKPACVGSSPTDGTKPWGSEALTAKHSVLTRANGVRLPADPRAIGDRLMAGPQALTLFVEVRVLVPERSRCAMKALFDNRIVDDARGRAPPRPQRCPCSQSGDGACPKSRRLWFDSRRGHYRGTETRLRFLVRDRTAGRRLSGVPRLRVELGSMSAGFGNRRPLGQIQPS